ncbi:hypothetical protein V6N13_082541 [Hibiscus sabdariffa]
MTPSGTWDVSLLLSLFPAFVMHLLASVVCIRVIDWISFDGTGIVNSRSTKSPASPCQWYPPPSQWICLNADGGVCPATKFAKASGLLRDSCGTWTRGYGHSIGITDVLTAELWAIHDGLIAAWELGFEFVQVQSDCAKAISALSVDNASRDSCALVRGIHSLCHRGWTIDFAWIPREANQVADQLIKNLPLSQFEQVYINAPPAHLVDLLTRDINGPPYN